MHAAFSEALCDLAGTDDVLVCSILGRQDMALTTFVGAEMQQIMLRFTRNPAGIHHSARQIQHDISEAAKATPTDLFYTADSALSKLVKEADTHCTRFFVHGFTPTGRLASSPFRTLFHKAKDRVVSLGFASVERIEFPVKSTYCELFLSVTQTQDGPNAVLISTPDAFSPDDLKDISSSIALKLDL